MIVPVVLLAGAAGAVLRFLASRALAVRPGIPWAVLLVNVVGSAIGGVVLALAERGDVSSDIRVVLLTGLCGGLTTFSTWSVETIQLVQAGRWRTAAWSVAGSLVLGVAVAAVAYLLAR